MKTAEVLIFDVNETLLDLGDIKSAVNITLKSEHAFTIWFTTLLQYSMVESIGRRKYGFSDIGRATLRMTAEKLKVNLTEVRCNEILNLITQLPAHADVKEGLKILRAKGTQLAAFTNGTSEALTKQMKNAGLTSYFDSLYSVDSVKSFKPQSITYQYVLKQLNCKAEKAMMVAAHPWDIAGAKNIGLQTTFIERNDQVYYPLLERATIHAKDLLDLAKHF